MLGVTVAIGDGWQECGETAARCMSAHTGLDCQVIDDWPNGHRLSHPYWAKLWIQDVFPEDDLLFFDSDLICQREWNPNDLLEGCDFAWVHDTSRQITAEAQKLGLDPTLYGNSGLMLIRKGCDVLKRTRAYCGARYIGRWPEQSAINLVLQHGGETSYKLLDETYNRLVRKHQIGNLPRINSVNVHFVGLRGDTGRLKEVQSKAIDKEKLP